MNAYPINLDIPCHAVHPAVTYSSSLSSTCKSIRTETSTVVPSMMVVILTSIPADYLPVLESNPLSTDEEALQAYSTLCQAPMSQISTPSRSPPWGLITPIYILMPVTWSLSSWGSRRKDGPRPSWPPSLYQQLYRRPHRPLDPVHR